MFPIYRECFAVLCPSEATFYFSGNDSLFNRRKMHIKSSFFVGADCIRPCSPIQRVNAIDPYENIEGLWTVLKEALARAALGCKIKI